MNPHSVCIHRGYTVEIQPAFSVSWGKLQCAFLGKEPGTVPEISPMVNPQPQPGSRGTAQARRPCRLHRLRWCLRQRQRLREKVLGG